MEWIALKAQLLQAGAVRVEGEPIPVACIGRSTAGPGAGGSGSIFFSMGGRRVRLGMNRRSPVTLRYLGNGEAAVIIDGHIYSGVLEPVGLHCPRQAYITLSERCIYRCRYCMVHRLKGEIKPPVQIVESVKSVLDRVDAISVTSGVAESIEKDEERTLALLRLLRPLGLPVGVSIYPRPETPLHLHELGVVEVKFNVETASERLFEEMCPGLRRQEIWRVLERSVELFGENHVFSNVIIGLGETDAELEEIIEGLADAGVIPVCRPLNPVPSLPALRRPAAARLLDVAGMEERVLKRAGLDTKVARTMCIACTGCDLVPGRDT
ncbi:MAG: radical SAM protein [Methanomicrobiales archaeon]|nr:radical SAM protein [Methanomicrobiales archaeon]